MISEKLTNLDTPSKESEDFDLLKETAIDVGIPVGKIPRAKTEAYNRLYKASKDYSLEVHREMYDSKRGIQHNGSELVHSQNIRRTAHNVMCIMLFGTEYDATSSTDRRRAANFAHYVAGRDQYVEEVQDTKG